MTAGSETDRTRLFETHPEIIVEPTRLAISNAAIQAGRDGEAARALNAHRTLLLAAQRANNRRVQVIALGGIGIGFGAGLVIGLTKFDDAVYAERKITRTAIGCAAIGGVIGYVLSRPRGYPR